MIDKEFGKFIVVCDTCGEEGEPYDTFQDAVDSKKEKHWMSLCIDGEWTDLCPDCKEGA